MEEKKEKLSLVLPEAKSAAFVDIEESRQLEQELEKLKTKHKRVFRTSAILLLLILLFSAGLFVYKKSQAEPIASRVVESAKDEKTVKKNQTVPSSLESSSGVNKEAEEKMNEEESQEIEVVNKYPYLVPKERAEGWIYMIQNNSEETLKCTLVEEQLAPDGRVVAQSKKELKGLNSKTVLPYLVVFEKGANEARLSFSDIQEDHEYSWAGYELMPNTYFEDDDCVIEFTNIEKYPIPGRAYLAVFREGEENEFGQFFILEDMFQQIQPGETSTVSFYLGKDKTYSIPKIYPTQYLSLVKRGESLEREVVKLDPELMEKVQVEVLPLEYRYQSGRVDSFGPDFYQGIIIRNESSEAVSVELNIRGSYTSGKEHVWRRYFRSLLPGQDYVLYERGSDISQVQLTKVVPEQDFERMTTIEGVSIEKTGDQYLATVKNEGEEAMWVPPIYLFYGKDGQSTAIQEISFKVDESSYGSQAFLLAPGAERHRVIGYPEDHGELLFWAESIQGEDNYNFKNDIPEFLYPLGTKKTKEKSKVPIPTKRAEEMLAVEESWSEGQLQLSLSNLTTNYLEAIIEVQYWRDDELALIEPKIAKLIPKQKNVKAISPLLFADDRVEIKSKNSRISTTYSVELWQDKKRPFEKYKFRYVDADDGIIISGGNHQYDEKLTIPEKIDGKVVREIENLPFDIQNWLKELSIPATVRKIHPRFCSAASPLRKIIFQGSEKEWSRIELPDDFEEDYQIVFEKRDP